MAINKALKIRIYPNKHQEKQILQTLGSCRFIYNRMLAERISVYEELKNDKEKLYNYKYKTEKQYKEEFEWLKIPEANALQQSRIDLDSAFNRFFKSIKKDKKVGFPKFHKKGQKDSYRTPASIHFDFESRKIKLPKLGWINFRDRRNEIKGVIKSATVSRTKTGKYFVSVLYEQEIETKEIKLNNDLKIKGLDCSLQNFYVDENGNSPNYERLYRKYEPRLKFLQRKVSRKQKGSNNRRKAQLRVNKVFEKIANSRKDFTHKLSSKLIEENDVIVVENLNLQNMARCLNLGKSVNDLGYGEFIRQLKYKSLWQNKTLIEADKWFASSKLCSNCNYKNVDLQLSDREWTCPECGTFHDRDCNAAVNLKNYGIKEIGKEFPEFKSMEIKTSATKQLVTSLVDEVENLTRR